MAIGNQVGNLLLYNFYEEINGSPRAHKCSDLCQSPSSAAKSIKLTQKVFFHGTLW